MVIKTQSFHFKMSILCETWSSPLGLCVCIHACTHVLCVCTCARAHTCVCALLGPGESCLLMCCLWRVGCAAGWLGPAAPSADSPVLRGFARVSVRCAVPVRLMPKVRLFGEQCWSDAARAQTPPSLGFNRCLGTQLTALTRGPLPGLGSGPGC